MSRCAQSSLLRFAIAAMFSCAPATLTAQQSTLLADTYVTTARPSTNYGALSNLYVNPAGTALLRFDLTAIPAKTTSAQIGRATLRVYVNRVNTPGALTLSPVQADWREAAVTSQTVPPVGSAVDVEAATDEGQWIVFDVTALVKKWADAPSTNFGVALTSTSADVVLDSKENDSTAHPATLDISLAAGSGGVAASGPAGAVGPAGPAGPQGPPGLPGPQGVQGLQGIKGDPGGLVFRGNWNTGNTYAANDLVSYGGAAWVSLVASNVNFVPGTSATTGAGAWGLLVPAATTPASSPPGGSGSAASLGFKGAYSASATYGTNDVVSYSNGAWVSLQDNNSGNTPGSIAGTWAVLVPASTASTTTIINNNLSYQGGYASTTNYAHSDLVTWNGAVWASLHDSNHGNTPDASAGDWAVAVPAAVGLAGPKGDRGDMGLQGPPGTSGQAGVQGPQGLRGDPGATGRPGFVYQGPYASATNYAGGDVVLWQGSSFASLHDGNHGNTPDSSPSDWGLLTSTGPMGDKGDAGLAGPQGLQGPAGQMGSPGQQGPTGPVGSTGPQGLPGRDGAQGLTGSTGPAGPRGDPGPAGLNFRGTYDSTINYGQNDAVTYQNQTWLSLTPGNNGQTPSYSPLYWTLLAAQGATGPQGPAGVTGPVGAKGDTGMQGVQGMQGATGPAGPQGSPGMLFQGAYQSTTNYALHDAVSDGGGTWLSLHTANHGNQPASSPQDWAQIAAPGASGANGPQGAQGAAGPAGAPGPQGNTGTQGPAGPSGPQGPPVAFRGAWNGTSAYATGDAVSLSGSTWIATAPISATPPGSAPQWSLLAQAGVPGAAGAKGDAGTAGPTGATGAQGVAGPQGLPGVNWRGAYSSSTNYAAHDGASFNGSSYVSLTDSNAGNTPGGNGVTQWAVLALAGAAGSPGATGASGATGTAATVTVNSVTTGAPGSAAAVQNIGNASNAVLNFSIPAGAPGANGAAGTPGIVYVGTYQAGSGYRVNDAVTLNGSTYLSRTANNTANPAADVANGTGNWSLLVSKGDPGPASVSIGTVSTGSTASVTNSGTANAATLNFVLPQGPAGPAGAAGLTWRGTYVDGTQYSATDAVSFSNSAWIAIASSRNVPPSGNASSSSAWQLLAAQGPTGATGAPGPTGATPSFGIGTVTTGAAGTPAAATITGSAATPVLNLTIPQGVAGAAGSGSGSGGAVFASVHTTQSNLTAAQFYTLGQDKTYTNESPAAMTLMPASCLVSSVRLYNSAGANATVEFRAGTTPTTLTTRFSCTAAANVTTTCNPSSANDLSGTLADLRITGGSSATSYVFATFSCN